MSAVFVRVLILAAVAAGGVVAVLAARGVVGRQRSAALGASPYQPADVSEAAVRILAFHTADCRQCFTLQAPALARVLAARGGHVHVQDVDAIAEAELAARYHVLTVPTTVVLDAVGQARAVNYGFATTDRLLTQVDAALAGQASPAAVAPVAG